jgi:hypothetical protein
MASAKVGTFLEIVGLSTLLSIAYGLVMDQITIRICPEYFTVFHPNPLDIQNLTLLALFWGVVATWWMGVILGVLIAGSALAGSMPPAPYQSVKRRLYKLIITTAICTFMFGALVKVAGLTMPPMAQWPWYNDFPFATQ